MIRTCAILMFFWFMAAALSPSSAQSAGTLSGARLSIFGLGPIRIGMSVADVERASGLAFRGIVEQSGQSCYYVDYQLPSGEISLLIKSGRVAGVSINGSTYSTMSGIRGGDSESKVRAAYRAGLSEFRSTSTDPSDALIFTPKDPSEGQYRMVFTLMADPLGGAPSVVAGIHAAKLPDGRHLLTGAAGDGCWDHVSAAWQLSPTKSIQLRDASMPGEEFALSPNLKYGVSTLYDPKRPSDPSVRGKIRAWDAVTGARIAEWPAHSATIQSLALSPRGDLLASSASDRSVTVWRLPEGRQIASWVDPTESIQSLSFDGAGTILVGSGNKVVRVWTAATGSLRSSIAKSDGPTVVSPDGSLIASQSAVFEVRSGRVVRPIQVDGASYCMAFSPDGRYFALCQWDRIDFWDVSSWRIVWKFQRQSRHVPFNSLAFHPNGQQLATTLGDSIWLLDLRTGEPIAIVPGSRKATTFTALGFTSGDNALVAADGTQLNRWSTGNAIVAAPGTNAMNGGRLEANIVAAALGRSATNGGTLELTVPVHIGIEVTFSVTPPLPANHTFSWVIDGKPTGDGARIIRWLPPGQHTVELQAWEAGSYANSTPATITAATAPSRTARMRVNVNENPEWGCFGRLGSGCNDGPTTNFAFTTGVTVSIACRGKLDQVCVSTSMSVGAIKHDKCCEEQKEQGKPPGFWCDNRSDKEDQTVCTAEWAQAKLDSQLALMVRPSAAIPRFIHTWVYPPDGNDTPSQGNKGWWQALAGSGVIMGYSDSQPDKREQSVCKSGRASRQRISEMKNVDLAVGPIFSKTHGWICD